jgi:transketolase
MTRKKTAQEIKDRAPFLRGRILKMVNAAGSGHPGGSLSVIDLLSTLMMGWGHFAPNSNRKDWLILGKGHAVPALYSILIELNYIEEEELFTYRKFGSRLQGHPDRNKLPHIQINTGHLGQGLSIGVGIALAEKLSKSDKKVYVMLGNGDLNEGQTWEAIQSAAKFDLSNLIVFIDDNRLTQHGVAEDVMDVYPLKPKFEDHKWWAQNIDGHNFEEILTGLQAASTQDRPVALICQTIKGKGVSFMENKAKWHSCNLPDDLLKKALNELKENNGV